MRIISKYKTLSIEVYSLSLYLKFIGKHSEKFKSKLFEMEVNFTIVSLVLILVWLAYKKLTAKFSIFDERGVCYVKPVVLFGNISRVVLGRTSLFNVIDELYKKFSKEK